MQALFTSSEGIGARLREWPAALGCGGRAALRRSVAGVVASFLMTECVRGAATVSEGQGSA
jgi:hypothetical protein